MANRPEWALKIDGQLIKDLAEKYKLDPDLIVALIQQESGGEKWRCRWEPASERYVIRSQDYASHLGITPETERMFQMCSWGGLQIMGFKARELGFIGHLPQLCLLDIGLDYGCQFLQKLSQRYGIETDVVSAYNQGSPRKTPGGMYLNQVTYVDPVASLLRELRTI